MYRIACFFLLCSLTAFAADCGNGKDNGKGDPKCHGVGNTTGDNNNVINNENINSFKINNSSKSTSNSYAEGGKGGNSSSNATGGTATATGGNSTASQSQTANGGNATNGGQSNVQVTNQVRQASSAIAPDAYPSAPCRVSSSMGGSSPLGGLSFGTSKMDNECDKRETARAFMNLGQTGAALQILCTTKAAKQAKLTVCK